MTTPEKNVIVTNVGWCIRRVREEGTERHPDYAVAADDVCNKLSFLLDWLREAQEKEEAMT